MSDGYRAALAFSRTADTNAYTAGDVVGTGTGSGGAVLTLNFSNPSGEHAPQGELLITTAKLEIDVAAVPSGMTSFRLYLYNASPASALADNAAWDDPSGDRGQLIDYIDLGTPVDLGSTLYVKTDGINTELAMPAGGAIYGYLVTNGGYTPGSADAFRITLHAVAV